MERNQINRNSGASTGLPELNVANNEWLASPDDVSGAGLEGRMLRAARSEALSLAWITDSPEESLPRLLEKKLQEAKLYVQRQRQIRGKTERIIAMAF